MRSTRLLFGLLVSLLEPTLNTVIYPHLQWDPRNPFFKGSRSLHVETMSRINIVCPNPALVPAKLNNIIPKEQLYENLWIVDKSSYDACAVNTAIKTNRLVMECNKPLQMNYFTIVFQQFSASANGLEFTPGKEYYFIATSDGKEISLTKTSGGHCASHNMKMAVYVCTDSYDAKCKENSDSPSTAVPFNCPTTAAPTTTVPTTTAAPTPPQCADFSTLLSIYNNTKGIPTISNQTSLIPGLVTALQRLEEKLVTMETKLDNCTSKSTTCTEPPTTQAPTTTSAPTTTAAPTTTSAPTTPPIYESCAAAYTAGARANGVYTINPGGLGAFGVYCDHTTDGGGWAVFQKRFNGKVDFSVKGWTDYVNGFGNLTGEFWLGLDYIYRLASTPVKLRVDLAAADGEKRFALFSGFKIADKAHKYTLTAGSYIGGTAGDSLSFSNNANFSTFDQDNDKWDKDSCANVFKGAWWHAICHESSLNGFYRNGPHPDHFADGIIWKSWKGYSYSYAQSEMKVKA